MQSVISIAETNYKTIILDIAAVIVITFLPAISHLTSIPLYQFEPMRIIMVMCLLFTTRRNTYLIGLALPLFSHLIAAHPAFVKLFLVSSELVLNIYLFYLIEKRADNKFISLLSAIFISKIYYYIVKAGLLSIGLMHGELVTTPLYIQLIIALVLSCIIYLYNRKERVSKII